MKIGQDKPYLLVIRNIIPKNPLRSAVNLLETIYPYISYMTEVVSYSLRRVKNHSPICDIMRYDHTAKIVSNIGFKTIAISRAHFNAMGVFAEIVLFQYPRCAIICIWSPLLSWFYKAFYKWNYRFSFKYTSYNSDTENHISYNRIWVKENCHSDCYCRHQRN